MSDGKYPIKTFSIATDLARCNLCSTSYVNIYYISGNFPFALSLPPSRKELHLAKEISDNTSFALFLKFLLPYLSYTPFLSLIFIFILLDFLSCLFTSPVHHSPRGPLCFICTTAANITGHVIHCQFILKPC